MYGKYFCTLFLTVVILLTKPGIGSAQETDYYGLVYNEVARFNGNYVEADWITRVILYQSEVHFVDPLLVTAVFEQESGFQLGAISSAGAIGLAQLMPATAQGLGVNPYEPLENVGGGVRYLRIQLDRFAGYGEWAVTYALAAYNAGPQAVIQYGGVPPYTETINYVRSIAAIYGRISANR